jgi:hypothetical protein
MMVDKEKSLTEETKNNEFFSRSLKFSPNFLSPNNLVVIIFDF